MSTAKAVTAAALTLLLALSRAHGQPSPPSAAATGDGSPAAAADAAPPAGLDKPPRLLHFVPAEEPPALVRREHVQVILLIDVDEHGKVSAVKVETPAGDGFDEAAVAAAQQFVFAPGESGGKPVPVRITYRYRFDYEPEPPPAPLLTTTPEAAAPAATAPAGTVPLSGYVRRKGDRVPVAGVSAILDQGAVETVTDEAGRFAFAGVLPGEHVLRLRGGDVAASETKIQAHPGKSLELTLYVTARERYVTTVRAAKVVVETVEQTLSQDEIKKIPGTQGDALKAVQNLPGVARAPFGLGLLVVWGSQPQDTRTYVDGVFIPTLYHFGGLRSTVNSEMVQSLTFIPGGYSAERGLGLGGIVEVETRTPRRDGYHGYVQLDLIDGSLMVEGPIGKKLSFAVALRRSWIDVFLPLFTFGRGFQLSPKYYDYQARLTYRPTSRDELGLFIFGSDDQLSVDTDPSNQAVAQQFDSHTYYFRTLLTWLHRFGHGATFSMVTSVGYDVSQVQSQSSSGISSTDAPLLSYTLRATARVPVTDFLRIDGGLDYEGNYYTLDQSSSAVNAGRGFFGGSVPNHLVLYTDHVAPWLSAPFSLLNHRLLITPQLRLQVFTFLGYPGETAEFSSVFVKPDPRLQLRYQVLPWLAFKGSIGLYHQAPLPQSFSALTGNPQLGPESGTHYVLGVDFKPMAKLNITIEGFYKDLRDLVISGQYPTDPLSINDSTGRVYGGQMLVRLDLWKNLFGWVSYTLSHSERKDHPNQDWHIFQFDQTHILTIIASYKLPRGFQVGVRFRYVTGNPLTPVLGASYDSNLDRYIPIQGPTNSGRLGSFNQLDVRLDKTFTFNRWSLGLYLDVQNVYDASNPEGVVYNFNYTQQSTVNGLPILPVFGIRGDF